MNLASSSYYYQPKDDGDGQALRDAELKGHIERIQGEFPATGIGVWAGSFVAKGSW